MALTLEKLLHLINAGKISIGSPLDSWPVGAIYESVLSTSPNELFGGGTWERMGGRVLIGADVTYPAGATGGEATHVITTAEMANHAHQQMVNSWNYALAEAINVGNGTPGNYEGYAMGQSNLITDGNGPMNTLSVGSNAAHNNMQPYEAVYRWKRTA